MYCKYCGSFWKSKNSLGQHEVHCKDNPNRILVTHNCAPRRVSKECPYCGLLKEDTTDAGFQKHVNSCEKNPNRVIYKQNRISKTCPYCKELKNTTIAGFALHIKMCKDNPNKLSPKPFSKETRKLLSKKAKERGLGGYKMTPNSTRSHRGYYKGIYCMSSWELAFVAYQIAKGKEVKQCVEKFPYIFEGKKHFYTPDFIIDGVYYEIKNWHRPETDAKLKYFPSDKQIILIEGIKSNKLYIDYVEDLYGKNFWEVMYE